MCIAAGGRRWDAAECADLQHRNHAAKHPSRPSSKERAAETAEALLLLFSNTQTCRARLQG